MFRMEKTASLMYIYPGWLAHEGGWREKKKQFKQQAGIPSWLKAFHSYT